MLYLAPETVDMTKAGNTRTPPRKAAKPSDRTAKARYSAKGQDSRVSLNQRVLGGLILNPDADFPERRPGAGQSNAFSWYAGVKRCMPADKMSLE